VKEVSNVQLQSNGQLQSGNEHILIIFNILILNVLVTLFNQWFQLA